MSANDVERLWTIHALNRDIANVQTALHEVQPELECIEVERSYIGGTVHIAVRVPIGQAFTAEMAIQDAIDVGNKVIDHPVVIREVFLTHEAG